MNKFRPIFIRLTAVALFGLAASSCQNYSHDGITSSSKEDKLPEIGGKYEEEIGQILVLARKEEWESASVLASALHALDPEEDRVRRIYEWVQNETNRRREKALEEEISHISAQNSRFTPTVANTFLENRKRGLPLPSGLRKAIEAVGRDGIIPSTYESYIEESGRMFKIDEPEAGMSEILNKQVSIQVNDVTLESIIFEIGEAQGINFVADKGIEAFKQKLAVNMQNGVSLREFLDYVSRNMKVDFQVGKDLIWVTDGSDATKLREETRFYRLKRGFVMPAQFGATQVTQVTTTKDKVATTTETAKRDLFVADGAPLLPSLDYAIKEFFSGKYMIDYERNLVVASGTHDQLRVLEDIIREFDTPLQQVLIEARFITVTKAAFLQLGVSWETGRDPSAIRRDSADFTGFGTNVGLGLEETFTNVFGRSNLTATLTALEQSGESQTLSSPRITVINNLPATISDGKVQYYYEEYTVSQTTTEKLSTSTLVPKGKPTKLTSGVSLDVLASIGGDGRSVLLALHPKVSQDVELVTFATVSDRDETGKVVKSFDIKLPESRDQEISTRVVVQSGETVVMGGVVQRDQSTFTESVPILGSLPIIGAAFRKRTEFDQPRYLLIFVTATLLSDDGRFIEVVD